MLLIGFSEICEDVASFAWGGHFDCHNVVRHHKDVNDLINYGLMANPMKNLPVLENVIKKSRGSGGMPPRKFLKFALQMVHSESI